MFPDRAALSGAGAPSVSSGVQSGGFLWLSRGWGGGSLSLSDLSSRAHELLHTQPSESATGVVLRCPDSPVVAPSCRNPGLGTPGLSPTFPTDSPCLSQLPSKSTLPYFLISLMIFFPEALPYMPAFFPLVEGSSRSPYSQSMPRAGMATAITIPHPGETGVSARCLV